MIVFFQGRSARWCKCCDRLPTCARVLSYRSAPDASCNFAGPRPPARTGLPETIALALFLGALCTGCGTTRVTDSRRTATEQLLLSGAIDRAVDDIDCEPLANKSIYFEIDMVQPSEDLRYLIDTMRQKLLASGCTLKDKKADAEVVVNLRVGVVGTDSNRVIFGVPSVNVPPVLAAVGGSPMSVPSIPEVPLVTKQAQRGVAKIGLFAYDQKTGKAVWQSGALPTSSTASEVWVLGAGPWQWGTIYDQPKFAGGELPLAGLRRRQPEHVEETEGITVASTVVFDRAARDLPSVETEPGKIQLVGHAEPAAEQKPAGTEPAPRVNQRPRNRQQPPRPNRLLRQRQANLVPRRIQNRHSCPPRLPRPRSCNFPARMTTRPAPKPVTNRHRRPARPSPANRAGPDNSPAAGR